MASLMLIDLACFSPGRSAEQKLPASLAGILHGRKAG